MFTKKNLLSLWRTQAMGWGVILFLLCLPAFTKAQDNGNPNAKLGNPATFIVNKVDEVIYNSSADVTLFQFSVTTNPDVDGNKFGISHVAFTICDKVKSGKTYDHIMANLSNIKAEIGDYKKLTSTSTISGTSGTISYGYDPSCNGYGPNPALKIENGSFPRSFHIIIQIPGRFTSAPGTMAFKWANFCAETSISGGGIGCLVECNVKAGITNNSGTSVLTCKDASISLTATGGSSYMWSNGAKTASITVNAAGDYTVTAVGANGCTDSKSITITDNIGNPIISVDPTSAELTCKNPSATLTVVCNGDAGASYNWSTGDKTASITVNQANSYSVTVTGSNGCKSSTSVNVTSNKNGPSNLVITPTPANATITCSNPSVTLSVTCSGGTYLWSTTETTPSIVVTAGKTYTVTATGSNGCTSTASALVSENKTLEKAPVISSNNAKLTCANPTAVLSVTCDASATYVWSTKATGATALVTAAGTYYVTATGTNGCTATTSIVVAADKNPPSTPSITASIPKLTCANPSLVLSVVCDAGATYAWSTKVTGATALVTAAGTYYVTATGTNGCTSTASKLIEADKNPPSTPSITASIPKLTCANPSLVLSVVCDAGATYAWSTKVSGATALVTAAGTYYVTATGTNGCTSTASKLIEADKNPPSTPSITASIPKLTCANPSLVLSVVCDAGATYAWSTKVSGATALVTAAGTYYVTATGTNGCTSTASKLIEADKNPPSTPSITASIPKLTCANPTLVLSVVCDAGATYAWSTKVSGATALVTAAGTYYVTATGTNGCTSTASKLIEADKNPPSTPSITASIPKLTCANPSLVLSVVCDAGATYAWSTKVSGATALVTAAGTYYVTATGTNGCTSTASKMIDEDKTLAVPVIVATFDKITCSNPTSKLSVTCDADATYVWSTGVSGSSSLVTAGGTYRVTATGTNGCTSTASKMIDEDKNAPDAEISAKDGVTVLCENTPSIVLTASGGASYLWSTGETTASITVVAAGDYSVTVTGANGCTDDATITITFKPTPKIFCSYTQGYFGNAGGKSSFFSGADCKTQQSTENAINTAKAAWGNGWMIGKIYLNGNVDPNKPDVTAAQIINYLPSGGPAMTYNSDVFPASSSELKSTLFAQTLTLGLNIGINGGPMGAFGQWVIPASFSVTKTGSCSGEGMGEGTTYSMPAEVVSMTVAQLYAAASKAIKDGDAKAGAYATAAGKLNEAFDACGMISPADKVVSKFSTMNAGMLGAFAAPTTNTLKVTAYPNPFNDRVFIKFASPVSGNAVVEFFDMTGRRLQSINKSNIVAGQENLVEYVVPVSFTRAIIYKVTIGEFSINGRMISPIR